MDSMEGLAIKMIIYDIQPRLLPFCLERASSYRSVIIYVAPLQEQNIQKLIAHLTSPAAVYFKRAA